MAGKFATAAIVVAFRQKTLLPLDDVLGCLRDTIPNLSRSALHRCLQRHGISRLPVEAVKDQARQCPRNQPVSASTASAQINAPSESKSGSKGEVFRTVQLALALGVSHMDLVRPNKSDLTALSLDSRTRQKVPEGSSTKGRRLYGLEHIDWRPLTGQNFGPR
ncbi:hypothetical protein ABID25_006374 [Mesorhizobium abyssinicae]